MRKLAILIILVATAAVVLAQDNPPKTASAQSDAKKAFEKMKTLAGSWQGTVMDIPINFTIRAASSGTAILHEGNTSGGGPQNMRSLCSTWRGIVCSRPIIVTPGIVLAGRGRCRRMERRSSSVFSMSPDRRGEDT